MKQGTLINSHEMNLKSVRFRNIQCSLANIKKALNLPAGVVYAFPFIYFLRFQ